MDVNKYPHVNEYPSSYSSTNYHLSTLQAIADGRLRPQELDPRRRDELRQVLLWEIDKERVRREVIMDEILELRNSVSDTARYIETGGMSLEERIGRKVALKHAIRMYGGMEPFSSCRATER